MTTDRIDIHDSAQNFETGLRHLRENKLRLSERNVELISRGKLRGRLNAVRREERVVRLRFNRHSCAITSVATRVLRAGGNRRAYDGCYQKPFIDVLAPTCTRHDITNPSQSHAGDDAHGNSLCEN